MSDTTNVPSRNLLRINKPFHGAYRQELDEPENTPANSESDPAAAANQTQNPELNPEEKVYKTRYDSLKAHYDKMINESRRRETELQSQLATSSLTTKAMPKTAEELNEWSRKYPDLYGMLVTVIRKEFSTKEEQLNSRISEVESNSAKAKRESAEAALMRLHPDLPELLVSKEFHEWVATQPMDIQKGLYENQEDYLLAARYIDLYKSDKGLKKVQNKQQKTPLSNAALAVTPNGGNVTDSELPQGKQFKVSDIKKMSRSEYDRNEEAIDKARLEGRLIIDV